MFSLISKKVTDFFVRRGYVDENMWDTYNYGFEILISSIFGCGTIIGLGMVLGSAFESVLFLICLIFLRRYTGGYHASTYARCNFLMIFSYVMSLSIYRFLAGHKLIAFILMLSFFFPFLYIISRFSPIENANKPITTEERRVHNIKGTVLFLIYYILATSLTVLNVDFGILVHVVLSLVELTMIVEIIKQRLITYEEKCFENDG